MIFSSSNRNALSDQPQEAGREWPQALLGALPIALFGLVYVFKSFEYAQVLDSHSGVRLLWVAHVLVLAGFIIGWLKGFPRWAISYTAVAIIFSYWLSGLHSPFSIFGQDYRMSPWGWRAWIPLLAASLIPLAITRSLRPLLQFGRELVREWPRLSFFVYCGWVWMMLGATYDNKTWYENTLFLPIDVLVVTLAYSGGAVAYLVLAQRWQRVAAMFAPLFLVLVADTISQSVQHGYLTYNLYAGAALFMWVLLIFSPAVLSFLLRQLGRFQPLPKP